MVSVFPGRALQRVDARLRRAMGASPESITTILSIETLFMAKPNGSCYGSRDDGDGSHRVPVEYVAGALERRERLLEGVLELRVELFDRPAVGAMQHADRARLRIEEDLVVAHADDLPTDALCLVGAEVARERRDLVGRHLLQPLDAQLLLLGLGRNRADHAAPGRWRDAVRAHIIAR